MGTGLSSVPPGDVQGPTDFIRCVPYSCTMTARSCVGRQDKLSKLRSGAEKENWAQGMKSVGLNLSMRACGDCLDGRKIRARLAAVEGTMDSNEAQSVEVPQLAVIPGGASKPKAKPKSRGRKPPAPVLHLPLKPPGKPQEAPVVAASMKVAVKQPAPKKPPPKAKPKPPVAVKKPTAPTKPVLVPKSPVVQLADVTLPAFKVTRSTSVALKELCGILSQKAYGVTVTEAEMCRVALAHGVEKIRAELIG